MALLAAGPPYTDRRPVVLDGEIRDVHAATVAIGPGPVDMPVIDVSF